MANVFRFKDIQTDHFVIRHSLNADSFEIYRFNIFPGRGEIEYYTFDINGRQTGTRVKDGEEWKPWLVVPGRETGMLSDLIDALLEFGIEPHKHVLGSEEKTALENHLADMRRIVSRKLLVDLDL